MSRLLSAWVALIVFICELFLWAFHAFLAKHFILLMFSIFCHVQTAHHPQDKSLYYISSSPYFNHSLILYLLFSRAVLLSKIQVLKIASLVLQSYISQNIHPLFFPSFFSNLSKNATLYKCVLSFFRMNTVLLRFPCTISLSVSSVWDTWKTMKNTCCLWMCCYKKQNNLQLSPSSPSPSTFRQEVEFHSLITQPRGHF